METHFYYKVDNYSREWFSTESKVKRFIDGVTRYELENARVVGISSNIQVFQIAPPDMPNPFFYPRYTLYEFLKKEWPNSFLSENQRKFEDYYNEAE